MTAWGAVLFVLAGVVAAVGEPRPVALIVAGCAAATALFDVIAERSRYH